MQDEQIKELQKEWIERTGWSIQGAQFAIAIALLEVAQQLRARNELEAKRFST